MHVTGGATSNGMIWKIEEFSGQAASSPNDTFNNNATATAATS
jgi:hypothetical protein